MPHQTTRRGVFGDGCERCGAAIYNGRFCSVACARPDTDKPLSETTDAALLDWMEKRPQCELSYEGWDDNPRWQVHQVTGGRNDREWSLVGEGETVRDAIRAAMNGMPRRGR